MEVDAPVMARSLSRRLPIRRKSLLRPSISDDSIEIGIKHNVTKIINDEKILLIMLDEKILLIMLDFRVIFPRVQTKPCPVYLEHERVWKTHIVTLSGLVDHFILCVRNQLLQLCSLLSWYVTHK